MDEKMMILNMLQEGKISTEEACKLLEALEGGKSETKPPRPNMGGQPIPPQSPKTWDMHVDEKMRKIDEKLNKVGNKINNKFNIDSDKLSGDFSKKMEGLGSDIAESAVKFADRMVNYFGNIFDFNVDKYQVTKNYIYPVSGTPSIDLMSTNFSVRVNPSATNDILVNVFTNGNMQQADIDNYFKADISENQYRFECRFPDRVWGRIELLVPASLGSLNINTSNGKCEMSQVVSNTTKCHTSNGKIVMEQCKSDSIEAVTNNGKIVLDQLSADTVNLSTSNGKIEMVKCYFDIIDAKTSNGSIVASEVYKLKAKEAQYDLYTSNGKIAMELKEPGNCGYLIDANTSLGSIHVDLPQLNYSVDKKSYNTRSNAVIKSSNIDVAEEKIFIKANTSNASITIES